METHIANIQIESIDSDFSNHDKQLSEIIRDVSTKIEGNDEKRRARLEISEFVSNEVNNLNLNDIRNKNDITFELKNLEFEAGFSASDNLFELGRIDFDLLRKKAHVRLVASIAHACYFIGVANKIRRNYFDIKNGILKQKSSLLLTEMNKEPGLKIGVIGGGRLGMQLSRALLEFASVQPSELRISTRQPELLIEFKNKNVLCFFNNQKLAASVNILFMCVLPSQLHIVIDDIKNSLPEKCIIYNFVSGYSETHLKLLLGEHNLCTQFIINSNPIIKYNAPHIMRSMNWNHSLNIIECLCNQDMVNLINPFSAGKESTSLIEMNQYYKTMFVYAFINICTFMSLNKEETMNVVKTHVLYLTNKNLKLDESFFYETTNSKNEYFQFVNLVESISDSTTLSNKFQKIKALRMSLKNGFSSHFSEIAIWRNKNNI